MPSKVLITLSSTTRKFSYNTKLKHSFILFRLTWNTTKFHEIYIYSVRKNLPICLQLPLESPFFVGRKWEQHEVHLNSFKLIHTVLKSSTFSNPIEWNEISIRVMKKKDKARSICWELQALQSRGNLNFHCQSKNKPFILSEAIRGNCTDSGLILHFIFPNFFLYTPNW